MRKRTTKHNHLHPQTLCIDPWVVVKGSTPSGDLRYVCRTCNRSWSFTGKSVGRPTATDNGYCPKCNGFINNCKHQFETEMGERPNVTRQTNPS